MPHVATGSRDHSQAGYGRRDGYGVHHIGKGAVYARQTVVEAFAEMGVPPDFSYVATLPSANLKLIHRKLADGGIYFVDSRSNNPATAKITFRVTGCVHTLWHSDTGKITAASYTIANGRTIVPLHFGPWGQSL